MALKVRNDRLQGTENCVNVCYSSWFLPTINSSAKPFCWEAFLLVYTWKEQNEMLLSGGNRTWGIKIFRKWPLLWDCFVPPWLKLPELAVSWGCPAYNAETLRKGGHRKCCLFLLLSHMICKTCHSSWLYCHGLSLLVWLQSLQWQLVCKKALLFLRSFR